MFPLITSPYVSRVLGAENIGKYSFSISLANWFMIFASYGVVSYGVREIAKVRDDSERLNQTFSEIFFIKFIATLLTLIAYVVIIFLNPRTNTELMLFLVSALTIFFNFFSIDWFYMGLENFKIVTLRSLFVKATCLIFIFILVRQRDDYIIYALIMVLAYGFSNIFNFVYSKRFVKLSIKNLGFKFHIKKMSIFFYSSLIVSIYTIFDQVFLGFCSTNRDLAFYSRSKQIFSLMLSITLSISTVLNPKLSFLIENNFEKYKRILEKSLDYMYIFSIPSVLGIIVLAKDIMLFFGGKEFEGAYMSLVIVSVLVFTVSLETWQYKQLFVPLGKEKIGLRVQVLIALVSVAANLLLTPTFGYIGASVSIVIAEVTGTAYCIYYAKYKITEVKIKYNTKSLPKFVFSSLIMTLIIGGFRLFEFGYIYNILFGISAGALVYFGTLYLIKDDVCHEVVNYLLKKIT